jgi:hypothetical protein
MFLSPLLLPEPASAARLMTASRRAGAPSGAAYDNVASQFSSLADEMIAWLDGNPPALCYSDAWKASRREALEFSSTARFMQAFGNSPTQANLATFLAEAQAGKSVAQNAITLTQDADAACR